MKRKAFLLFLLLVSLLLIGCDSLAGKTKWTFKNCTSYDVDIDVENGSPSSFTVYAYSSKDVYVPGTSIYYEYNYANDVDIIQTGDDGTLLENRYLY